MDRFHELLSVVETLRSEKGCPWDRKQTFESLKSCLCEETEEVIEAIGRQDMENLCEELGDLFFLIVMYSQIAREQGVFSIEDVAEGACRKMVRRHPHVFGNPRDLSPEESLNLWNEIKKQEKDKKP